MVCLHCCVLYIGGHFGFEHQLDKTKGKTSACLADWCYWFLHAKFEGGDTFPCRFQPWFSDVQIKVGRDTHSHSSQELPEAERLESSYEHRWC